MFYFYADIIEMITSSVLRLLYYKRGIKIYSNNYIILKSKGNNGIDNFGTMHILN